jgi:Mrp family chromosome partitioning ATPase
MSATDQAFIRAYGAPVKSGVKATADLQARAALGTRPMSPVALNASVTKSWIARAEVASNEATTLHVAAEGTPIPATRIACIDIGIGTVIPAPHASFGPTRSPATSPIASVEVKAGPRSRPQQSAAAKPKLFSSFGQSPKASLSSFAGPSRQPITLATPLRPVLEIDSVRWPAQCELLLAQYNAQFSRLAEEIRLNAAHGQRVIAISGLTRGEGRTTLALCLAQLLSATGKIAVVDADFASPSLSAELGIATELGFDGILRGEAELAEVLIESLDNQLAILPLPHEPSQMTATPHAVGKSLADLAEHYEVVLVDAGPVCDESTASWLCEAGNCVDAIILAHDVRRTRTHQIATVCSQFDHLPVQVSIAEMFTKQ